MKAPRPKEVLTCFWQGLVNTINHDGIEHAGYLAFLGLLAMFPFLVLLFSLVGFVGAGDAGRHMVTAIFAAMPDSLTVALKPRIEEIVSGPPQGLLTISLLGALWTASSAVEGIRTILNRAYHVAAPPAYWLRRSLSVVQLLVFAFIATSAMLLVVSFQLAFRTFSDWINMHLNMETQIYISKLLIVMTGGILFLAVSSIYYLIPNIRQRFLAVAPGAIIVVLGWWGAASALTFYLSHFNQVNLIYGSLGGMIASLIFLYVCNVIFIFGAEFNYLLSLAMGLRTVPTPDARQTH